MRLRRLVAPKRREGVPGSGFPGNHPAFPTRLILRMTAFVRRFVSTEDRPSVGTPARLTTCMAAGPALH